MGAFPISRTIILTLSASVMTFKTLFLLFFKNILSYLSLLAFFSQMLELG